MTDVSLQFLGRAPLVVSVIDNPDGAGRVVLVTMEDPTDGRRLAALLPPDVAYSVAAQVIACAAEAEA